MDHNTEFTCTVEMAKALVVARLGCRTDLHEVIDPAGWGHLVAVIVAQRAPTAAGRRQLILELWQVLFDAKVVDLEDWDGAHELNARVRVH